jgi:hypothetical protein
MRPAANDRVEDVQPRPCLRLGDHGGVAGMTDAAVREIRPGVDPGLVSVDYELAD